MSLKVLSLYYLVLFASIVFVLWMAGCAAPDMSRREALGVVDLDRELRK